MEIFMVFQGNHEGLCILRSYFDEKQAIDFASEYVNQLNEFATPEGKLCVQPYGLQAPGERVVKWSNERLFYISVNKIRVIGLPAGFNETAAPLPNEAQQQTAVEDLREMYNAGPIDDDEWEVINADN